MLRTPAARRIASLVWALSIVAIVWLSLRPNVSLPVTFWNADKVYHFLAYAWLGALAIWSVPRRGWLMVAAAAAMVVLGGLLECGQAMVPGREASLADALSNAIGVVCGVWVAGRVERLADRFPVIRR